MPQRGFVDPRCSIGVPAMFCPPPLKENMHAQQEKKPPQAPEGGGKEGSMKQQQQGHVSALHTRINPDDAREFTKRPELDMD